jgi:hypothetical protein
MFLNIVKSMVAGIGAGMTKTVSSSLGGLTLPAAIGLSPALSISAKTGFNGILSNIVSRSLIAPSLVIGEYALAATLSLPEYTIMQEIGPHIGLGPKGKKRGGGMSGADLKNTGAI